MHKKKATASKHEDQHGKKKDHARSKNFKSNCKQRHNNSRNKHGRVLKWTLHGNVDINTAILERLERVVDSLQDNSVKMGQLLVCIMRSWTNKTRLMKSCLKIDKFLLTSTEKLKQSRKDLKETSVRLMKDSESWRRRCGPYLAVSL
ncbi:MAG: hypothetical protein CM15mV41_0080 [Caudoviricetes sp.]|nr:MAG: hypothetical protein CM15mV41_0080 [Caudoviricetes sp.]